MLRTNTTTCARFLTYVTGLVNQELLLQNEYLVAENRILKARLHPGWRLSDGERVTLEEIGRRFGIRCRERLGGLLRYYSRAPVKETAETVGISVATTVRRHVT